MTSHCGPAAAGPALVSVPARHLSNKCSHTNTTRRQTSAPERRETTSHHPISLGAAPATPTTRLPPAGRSIRGRGRATTSVSSVQTPVPVGQGLPGIGPRRGCSTAWRQATRRPMTAVHPVSTGPDPPRASGTIGARTSRIGPLARFSVCTDSRLRRRLRPRYKVLNPDYGGISFSRLHAQDPRAFHKPRAPLTVKIPFDMHTRPVSVLACPQQVRLYARSDPQAVAATVPILTCDGRLHCSLSQRRAPQPRE